MEFSGSALQRHSRSGRPPSTPITRASSVGSSVCRPQVAAPAESNSSTRTGRRCQAVSLRPECGGYAGRHLWGPRPEAMPGVCDLISAKLVPQSWTPKERRAPRPGVNGRIAQADTRWLPEWLLMRPRVHAFCTHAPCALPELCDLGSPRSNTGAGHSAAECEHDGAPGGDPSGAKWLGWAAWLSLWTATPALVIRDLLGRRKGAALMLTAADAGCWLCAGGRPCCALHVCWWGRNPLWSPTV